MNHCFVFQFQTLEYFCIISNIQKQLHLQAVGMEKRPA